MPRLVVQLDEPNDIDDGDLWVAMQLEDWPSFLPVLRDKLEELSAEDGVS